MENKKVIGLRLFEGVTQEVPQISILHCVDMFKIGWRLREASEPCGEWISDEELTKRGYEHLETLLGVSL